MKRPSEVAALVELFGCRDAAKEVDGGWWSSCPLARANGDGPVYCGEKMFVVLQEDGSGRYEPTCGHSVEDVIAAVSPMSNSNGASPVPPPAERATLQQSREQLFERCRTLARMPRILDWLRELLPQQGLVGEDDNGLLIYLALTSRLLDNPVSVAVKGPSSAGKSWCVDRVLQLIPDDGYHALSAMSERALVYSQVPLKHRVLVIYEGAGMTGDLASYLIRSLLSEGCVRYETVESTSEGLKPKLIEREGPTSLVVTTTAVSLHPENETRLLSLTVKDSPAQTRQVLVAMAEEDDPDVDIRPWPALQEWIASGGNKVTLPFGQALARSIPPRAVRLRRDFQSLLGLIRAHALLHQASRETDDRGRIVARIEDYAAVRELVADVFSAGIGATVKAETRETVEAVAALEPDHENGVPLPAVANQLQLDKSVVSRRWRVARDGGYLVNLEDRRGRPARLILGEPLPDETPILPDPDEVLHCCTPSGKGEGGPS
jgi:hypothetical protein